MSAAVAMEYPDEALDELQAAMCRAGNLRWKLHSGQKVIYDKYRAWEKTRQNDESAPKANTYPRVFCIAKSGRFGGSTLSLLIKTEDCIRNPGQSHRISSAFQKNISEIVNDVSHYVFEGLPPEVMPVYKGSQGPQGPGFYFPLQPGFTRQSVIRLIGLDLHPDGSRGQASDGDVITEAGFVVKLAYVVKNVVYRQYQGRPWASMILETSAPKDIDTDWERIFLPDAVERDAASFATIEDNPLLSRQEKDEFIAAMGGRGHPDCEREYFNVIGVPHEERVVPEFDPLKHVYELEQPPYAYGYVSVDPGSQDLFGIAGAWWDFDKALLYFCYDWAERNAATYDVALAIDDFEQDAWQRPSLVGIERDSFVYPGTRRVSKIDPTKDVVTGWHLREGAPAGSLTFWDGKFLRPNPYMRVTDIDRRLAADLDTQYGMTFHPADKTDSAEARTNAFRKAVNDGHIGVHPRCKKLISHLHGGRWNKTRSDWARTTTQGHFDLLACAIQLWRIVAQNRHLNPHPPIRPENVPRGTQIVESLPWQKDARPEHKQLKAARDVLGIGEQPRIRGQIRVRR